jgi:hypothetical protein
MNPDLILRFNTAMFGLYKRAKSEAHYTATRYMHMLDAHGGIETAHILINATTVSDGYTALWEKGRLDLTVEALIWENVEFHELFTSTEIQKALQRLIDYQYPPALKAKAQQ